VQQLRRLSVLVIWWPQVADVIIVLNFHAQTEDQIDNVKDSFYEKLECVLVP
jgi:hypothetical protein